ncbi:MAG: ISAs1 family transposase [Geminicoccaceae bacterium]
MPCIVKKSFEAARESGNFLIAQVKANQQSLLDAIETISANDDPVDASLTIDKKRHGRHEQRLVETFEVAGQLGSDWGDLIKTAVRVTRHTWRKDTKSGLWRQTSETAFYASQIALSAATLGNAIRQHWGIENRNHYVRDVSFFEDQSRIRTKPGHFARLRTFALNIMRANQTKNVSRELYINALNPDHAMSYAVT